VDTRADHLLFLELDLDNLKGEVIFNGPEDVALNFLPQTWVGREHRRAHPGVPFADLGPDQPIPITLIAFTG